LVKCQQELSYCSYGCAVFYKSNFRFPVGSTSITHSFSLPRTRLFGATFLLQTASATSTYRWFQYPPSSLR